VTSEGKKFEIRSKVVGVYDKGKAGAVVETESRIVDGEGTVYSKAVGSGFYVGQGNFGGPKGLYIQLWRGDWRAWLCEADADGMGMG